MQSPDEVNSTPMSHNPYSGLPDTCQPSSKHQLKQIDIKWNIQIKIALSDDKVHILIKILAENHMN